MKILKNTLKGEYDRWTDPGEYPNGCAAGPLPDGPLQLVGISGEVVVELDKDEISEIFKEGIDKFLEDEIDYPDGLKSVSLAVGWIIFTYDGCEAMFFCDKFEADVYQGSLQNGK
jgi:hypothetical protein